VVAPDTGEGSLDGQVMQAGRQNVKLVIEVSWRRSQDCNGKDLWQLLKHLHHSQLAKTP
jgi:hypothetical protein